MNAQASDILLIGGGHSHVAVLADWIRHGLPVESAALLTPASTLRYSGMVPGWISGEHSRDDGVVDLAALARAAGAKLILDSCVAIDPETRSVLTQGSGVLPFTTASINVGGMSQATRVLGDDPTLLDIRPIDRFVDTLEMVLGRARGLDSPKPVRRALQIAVVGGGAGGFEIAFGLRNAASISPPPDVSIVMGSGGPLPGFAPRAKRAVLKEAGRQAITCIKGNARFENGELTASDQPIGSFDCVIAAIGSAAPPWLRSSGLGVDESGFVVVDQFQRSTTHSHLLASGDCAARSDVPVAHSGVHAVHSGPVLAANLRSIAAGSAPMRSYRPRPASLYLISTGRGEAIATYGPFTAQGRWAHHLKAWIDKRWIASYAAIGESG